MGRPAVWSQCQVCSEWGHPARYHPHEFCVLIKAGQDPIDFVKRASVELGLVKKKKER